MRHWPAVFQNRGALCWSQTLHITGPARAIVCDSFRPRLLVWSCILAEGREPCRSACSPSHVSMCASACFERLSSDGCFPAAHSGGRQARTHPPQQLQARYLTELMFGAVAASSHPRAMLGEQAEWAQARYGALRSCPSLMDRRVASLASAVQALQLPKVVELPVSLAFPVGHARPSGCLGRAAQLRVVQSDFEPLASSSASKRFHRGAERPQRRTGRLRAEHAEGSLGLRKECCDHAARWADVLARPLRKEGNVPEATSSRRPR